METIDFYSGFEGEPELTIIREGTNGKSTALRLWEGYFDTILSATEPNENGEWEGVLLPYHLHTGWYDGEKWNCDEPARFLTQLKNTPPAQDWDEKTKAVYNELLNLLQDDHDGSYSIYISYD